MAIETHMINGANTIILMKHNHRYVVLEAENDWMAPTRLL